MATSQQELHTPCEGFPTSSPLAENSQAPLRATPPDRLYHAVLLVLCASVLALAFVLSIRDHSQVLIPIINLPLPELCTMRRFLGLDCPGCGLTRCFISLAHGDLASAWSYNPAGLWLFAIIALQIPFRTYQLWRIRNHRPELSLPLAVPILFATLAIALFTQWALRLAGIAF